MLSFKQFLKELAPALLTPTRHPQTGMVVNANTLANQKRKNQKTIGAQPTDTNRLAKEITGPEIFL